MSRYLFVVIPEKGHLHPVLGPAAHLRDRGHEVIFHAVADLRDPLASAGFDHFVGLEHPLDAGGPPPPKRGRELAKRLEDGPWLRAWIRHLLLDTVPAHVEQLERLLAELKPDVVVNDPMVYAAVIACERAGLPWVALSNSLNPVLPRPEQMEGPPLTSELLDTVDWLASDRDALFASFGVLAEFSGCDALSPHLTVALTTEKLVGRPVPGVEMVGPVEPVGDRGDEPEFPWNWLEDMPDAPLVVLSFGSQAYYQPERFRSVVEAVRGRTVRLVVSIGDLDPAEITPDLPPSVLPANVLMRPYLPQLRLLDRADLLITHGGANSVMEALARGVPILIVPLCNDQFHQAWFLERAGAGERLDLPREPEEVWRRIEPLLADGPVRCRARELGEDYARHDGARRTADLIMRLTSF